MNVSFEASGQVEIVVLFLTVSLQHFLEQSYIGAEI